MQFSILRAKTVCRDYSVKSPRTLVMQISEGISSKFTDFRSEMRKYRFRPSKISKLWRMLKSCQAYFHSKVQISISWNAGGFHVQWNLSWSCRIRFSTCTSIWDHASWRHQKEISEVLKVSKVFLSFFFMHRLHCRIVMDACNGNHLDLSIENRVRKSYKFCFRLHQSNYNILLSGVSL